MKRAQPARPVSLANRPARDVRRRGWVRRREAHEPSHLDVATQTIRNYVWAVWRVILINPLVQAYRLTHALLLSRTSHRIVLRIIMLCALHCTCMALAVLAFGSFYYAWVPRVSLTKDVWLQYGNDAPWAEVRLDASPSDALVWQKDARIPMFNRDQVYDVAIDFRVPINRVNQDVGNFMVELSLLTSDGTALYESRRPVLLVPEPLFVRWSSRMARMLWKPIFSEPMAPMQIVHVPLLRRVIPYASHTRTGPSSFRNKGYLASHAFVRIGRATPPSHAVTPYADDSSSVTLHPSSVQIDHATLRFDAFLSGASYLLYEYPVFSLGIFLFIFSTIELVVAGTMWLVSALYFSWIA